MRTLIVICIALIMGGCASARYKKHKQNLVVIQDLTQQLHEETILAEEYEIIQGLKDDLQEKRKRSKSPRV